jgi:phosphoribosylformimino-5-aminoimidazole carboxamide ribotide isomerase
MNQPNQQPKNEPFIVFPAIDLHLGQVVRMMKGDLNRQTHYKNTPADTASRWISSGTTWLHVINLDGAFSTSDQANQEAMQAILSVTREAGINVQFGGGIRSLQAIEQAFQAGVQRVILGTIVTQQPEFLAKCLKNWGAERVAVSLDARNGLVQTHGWQESTPLHAIPFAKQLADQGLKWLIYTDIARDGLLTGLNLAATSALAQETGLSVIASGGVEKLEDIQNAKNEGLAGAIAGKALYEQKIRLEELTRFIKTLGGN